MSLKKKYSKSDGNQIFRILISESGKLIIETRDVDKNQAYFHCFHLKSGRSIFSKKQFDESYWIGIEDVYNNVIYFHKFAKPDMPGHKGIYAFDISKKKFLWKNDDYAFLFVLNDLVYSYIQKFEGREFVTLNCKTGEIVESLGENLENIQELKDKSQAQKDFSQYRFPNFFSPEFVTDKSIVNIINNTTAGVELIGSVEYNVFDNLLVFNYHYKNESGSISNEMKVINIKTNQEVHSLMLNDNVNAYAPDSFFIYDDLLLVLREKKELLVYKLD